MKFLVLPARSWPAANARSAAFLNRDNWDDYTFRTLFHLSYVDHVGGRHEIGAVKIASFGMGTGKARTEVPDVFNELPTNFFSLGQDDEYYEKLNALGPDVRDEILRGLRDVALDQALFDAAIDEPVTGTSLLRSVPETSVRGQFKRLATGGVRLFRYSFEYALPATEGQPADVVVTFDVVPESQPPTNIHVLIGRNGVGKTRMLHLMSRALVDEASSPSEVGHFGTDPAGSGTTFAGLVSVTFSAFDPFAPLPELQNKTEGLRYSYVGLKRMAAADAKAQPPKSSSDLSAEFVASVALCRIGARAGRWRRALEMLEADPIFRDANVASLADDKVAAGASTGSGAVSRAAAALFEPLSSGHKIVLLTITRLIETVEERSLVLIDEPETHLHPPLLSAFVRSLSDLLTDRNGVAIVATHSPVILQEVPRSCVWIVRRSGATTKVDRPETETFGENVGVLTREVFGLEVTHSGFHRLLLNAAEDAGSYRPVVDRFGDQLGGEARALIRAIIASKNSDSDIV